MTLSFSTTELRPNFHLIRLDGALNAVTYQGLEKEVQRLLDAGTTHLVLDLKALVFLGSTGIRVLLQAFKSLRSRGGDLRTLGVNKPVQDVLDLVQLFPATQAFADKADLQRFLDATK